MASARRFEMNTARKIGLWKLFYKSGRIDGGVARAQKVFSEAIVSTRAASLGRLAELNTSDKLISKQRFRRWAFPAFCFPSLKVLYTKTAPTSGVGVGLFPPRLEARARSNSDPMPIQLHPHVRPPVLSISNFISPPHVCLITA